MIEPILYYAPAATCARPNRYYESQDKLLQKAARLALHIPCTISKTYVISAANLQNTRDRTISLARNYIHDGKRSEIVKTLRARPPPKKALRLKAKVKTPSALLVL